MRYLAKLVIKLNSSCLESIKADEHATTTHEGLPEVQLTPWKY